MFISKVSLLILSAMALSINAQVNEVSYHLAFSILLLLHCVIPFEVLLTEHP